MTELYPKRIFLIIPDAFMVESKNGSIEFQANVQLGKDSNNQPAIIVTVHDEKGRVINGSQFVADLKFSPSVPGGD